MGYIKLDWEWRRDSKVRKFRKLAGKAALTDLAELFVLMSIHGGRVDLNDMGEELDALDRLEMRRPKLDKFLGLCAECGLVDPEMLSMGVVTSNRAVKDAEKRLSRIESAKAASDAAAKKRKGRSD